MGAFRNFFRHKVFIKLLSWEYWPFGIVQAPLFLYYPWLSLKSRSLFFFSASNPGILMGGMFGESKYEVLELVPSSVKPKTILVKYPADLTTVKAGILEGGLDFPLIFKPDLGERGWMVRRINDENDAAAYLQEIRIDFLIQEFVDLPHEFGVFYIRYPDQKRGRVTSIVEKEMLSVTGDGIHSLRELIQGNDRAILQWEILINRFQNSLSRILQKGEKIELNSIGNHCLGTKFINGNALISEKLSASFDRISHQIEGFYFGRFDLRAASYGDLEEGKVQIVELNGCGAEPAHIYHPGYSFWSAVGVLIRHWHDIYVISRMNHAMGTQYITFSEGKAIYQKFKALKSLT